jgi:hypothetical protein
LDECAALLVKLSPPPNRERQSLGSPGARWPIGSLSQKSRPILDGRPRKVMRRSPMHPRHRR